METKVVATFTNDRGVTFELNRWTYSNNNVVWFIAMYRRENDVDPCCWHLTDLYHIKATGKADGYFLFGILTDSHIY